LTFCATHVLVLFVTAADTAARHAAVLKELAELGMALARRIALEAPVGEGDPALAFCRVSRAVRLTIALEQRLMAETGGLGAAGGPRLDQRAAKRLRGDIARFDVAALAEQAIGDHTESEDDADAGERERGERERERLTEGLIEQLEGYELEAFDDRPVVEVAAEICRALGVPFDVEFWAEEERRDLESYAAKASPARFGGPPFARLGRSGPSWPFRGVPRPP
jgi:hypothetical protein